MLEGRYAAVLEGRYAAVLEGRYAAVLEGRYAAVLEDRYAAVLEGRYAAPGTPCLLIIVMHTTIPLLLQVVYQPTDQQVDSMLWVVAGYVIVK